MALVVTAVIPTGDVEWVTTLTPKKGCFALSLASSNRCTVKSCMRLPVRLKNASRMKWSVTAKVLSTPCRLCRQADGNPKAGTEISNYE
eukprot:3759205-Amphidinium_carterae.1